MVMPAQQPLYSYPAVSVVQAPSYGYPVHTLTDRFQSLSVGQSASPSSYYASPIEPPPVHQQYAAGLTYVRSPNGIPVNVSNGAIPTEFREVHISNIQYQVKKKEMIAQISKIATPTSLEFHIDHAGKFKGSAVAMFESAADAEQVVNVLDKKTIKGKKVKVRLGKHQTPVNSSPLVVNGSTY
jgi:hypothetical protein